MRKTLFVICIVSTFAASTLEAQAARDKWADSVRSMIETAVRHGSTTGLDSARTIIDRVLTAMPNDPLMLHYDAYAIYRKVTLGMGRNAGMDPGPLLETARDELEQSAKKLQLPETFALQSAVFGQIIARSKNPITQMTLGMKSGDAVSKAVESGPRNPRVWLLRGIGAIFTPSMFGGGLDKAKEYLEKSIAFFDGDNPERPLPAWGRAEAYIWVGQVYAKQGKADAAKGAYQRAVDIEPDNGWARGLLAGTIQPVASR
jgi:tetratricopeptide (TPR) repeat protein